MPSKISDTDPHAQCVVQYIKNGELDSLKSWLGKNQGLADCYILKSNGPEGRSLLHIATDWPGHFPRVDETIRLLVKAGADVNARFTGNTPETPLHWAASSNDVNAVISLIDCGADINASGAVIAGGDPLEDAIGFQNWDAAKVLVQRGAKTVLGDEAALGMLKQMQHRFLPGQNPPNMGSINYAFWNACCAGQTHAAQFLLEKGADIQWVPDWCDDNPLDSALKSKNTELICWLQSIHAKPHSSQ